MDVIGIQFGHNATVALLRDGKIVAAVSQERFDYIKNSNALPREALRWLIRTFNVVPEEAYVAVSGVNVIPAQVGELSSRKGFIQALWELLDYKLPYMTEFLRKTLLLPYKMRLRTEGRKRSERFLTSLGFRKDHIIYVEHHLAHAYTPYYGFLGGRGSYLVITLDGSGDFYSGTIGIGSDGKYIRKVAIPIKDSLGYIYSQTTRFLGMKILEHEYKVMGLAPYAKRKYGEKVYERLFKPVLKVDESVPTLRATFPTARFLLYLKEKACGERFDNIAYGVQRLTEDIVVKLIKKSVDKFGLKRVATSGGVFMNVKANMLLAYDESLVDTFFTPSAGDESNPIGAAYYVYINVLKKDPKTVTPIKDLYLGPSFTNDDVEEYVKVNDLGRKYEVSYYDDIEGEVADLLVKGEVVARVKGRCEWGARALGNRSILGNPSLDETFYKVNDQIKMRDFWMPFAPTILKEREEEYIVNPLKRKAPYMIVAFRSTEEGRKSFRATIHKGDGTLRPQVLEKEWNPDYYRLIKEFEALTGIGGVLNTSFNLHGYPIACGIKEAFHVFENSGLKYLALENYLISKR